MKTVPPVLTAESLATLMQDTGLAGQPWSQPERLNYATMEFDEQEWANVESHIATAINPGVMIGEQGWTDSEQQPAILVVDSFDDTLEQECNSKTTIHDVTVDDPAKILSEQEWVNLGTCNHDAMEFSDGHPKWKCDPGRDLLVVRFGNRLGFGAITRNRNMLKCIGQQHILQRFLVLESNAMPGDGDLGPSQLVVKRMCLEPINVSMLLDSEKKKDNWESELMSRAINGLACNKSNTRVCYARTDAASPRVLFLFDLDFPTMITKGIRNVWADMMNAAELWSTHLRAPKSTLMTNVRSIGNNVTTNAQNG